MIILAIETSTPYMGVCILSEDRVLGEYTIQHEKGHSRRLLPAIKMIMEETTVKPADIDGIAVTVGPGSFTGIRIGIATAQGLSLGWKKSVLPIGSLEVLARGVCGFHGRICACLKARRGKVYAAFYDGNTLENLWGPSEAGIDDLTRAGYAIGGPVMFVGDGATQYWDDILRALPDAVKPPGVLMYPRPAWVGYIGIEAAKRGNWIEPHLLRPVYLRLPEAQVNLEKKLNWIWRG